MKTKLLLRLTAALLLAAPLAWAQVVTTTADSGAGSLRAVVAGAAPGATVTFTAGLSGQVIALTSEDILLDKNITIDATALPNGIQITNTVSFSRIITVATNVTASLKGLRLSGGRSQFDSVGNFGNGGAILNEGKLTLTDCYLDQNSALNGGAVFNLYGVLNLNQCAFVGNRTIPDLDAGHGGAVLNLAGTTTINQCTFTGNSVTSYDSYGGTGGAVHNYNGSLTINQSTITANSAVRGEKVMGYDSQPGDGGGIYNLGGNLLIFNSIVSANTADLNANISGTYTPKGTNLVAGDPLLLPLGNYGGPTPTMPPRTHSPALDAASDLTDVILPGNTNFVPTTFLFPNDQRGQPRLVGAHVDIGAVELQSLNIVSNSADAGPGSLRQVIAAGEAGPITFAAGLSGQSIPLQTALLLTNRCIIDASALPGGIQLLGSFRVMEVAANATVELRSLTLRNGFDTEKGAGIYNQGNLTLNRCTITDNGGGGEIITSAGGGIYNAGQLTLNQCTIAGNRANAGAGLYNHPAGTMLVNQCTIAGNESRFASGGIASYGPLTLFNSIIAGNQGGGVYDPDLTSYSLTITGTNLTTGDPLLAALGNYGGPTQTMPPLPGSPALDAGADSATNSFTTDQRGGWRRSGAGVDIGAVEIVAASGVPAVLTGLTRLPDGARQFSFTNLVAAGFTVYASTNVAAPFNTWSNLGPATESPLGSGSYQFTDPMATNHPQRYYRVSSP